MAKNSNKPILSISLLCSNRLDTIRRCLDSLEPIRNAIPSELILVDTSENPQVHSVLLEYTDIVKDFKWIKDFSAARNTGLKLAKGEWFMFVDDDEWFVDYDDLIRFFQSGEYRQYGCANYTVRNFFEKNFSYYSDSKASRLIKLFPETCFKSKVHEYIQPVKGQCKELSVIANHSGYVFENEAEKKRHYERNTELLFQMIEQEPYNFRWKVQLVQEYRSSFEYQKMKDYCLECLEIMKVGKAKEYLELGTFYVGAITAEINLKEYSEAELLTQQALADSRNTKLAMTYYHLFLGEIFLYLGDYENSIVECKEYLKEKEEWGEKKNKTLLEQQRCALLVDEALDDVKVMKAASVICCSSLMLGRTEELYTYFSQIEWEREVVYCQEEVQKYMVHGIGTLSYEPIFSDILTLAFRNKELRRLFFVEIEKQKEKNKSIYENVLVALSKSVAKDWYIFFAKILVFSKNELGSVDELINNLKELYKTVPNALALPEEVKEIVEEAGLDIWEYAIVVNFDQWKKNAIEIVEQGSLNHLKDIFTELENSRLSQDIRTIYLRIFIKKIELRSFNNEENSIMAYEKKMKDYMKETLDYYDGVYQEYIIQNMKSLLPTNYRMAIEMKNYFDTKEEKEAFRILDTICVLDQSNSKALNAYWNEKREFSYV